MNWSTRPGEPLWLNSLNQTVNWDLSGVSIGPGPTASRASAADLRRSHYKLGSPDSHASERRSWRKRNHGRDIRLVSVRTTASTVHRQSKLGTAKRGRLGNKAVPQFCERTAFKLPNTFLAQAHPVADFFERV